MPRFHVAGRYVLEAQRVDGRWGALRMGEGKRRPVNLHVPPDVEGAEFDHDLEDQLHESRRPGTWLWRLP